jgi:TatD DNase family protein
MIIDTHSHIYGEEFDNDIEMVIDRAKKAGVVNVLLPNIDAESIGRVNDMSAKYSGFCLPMMGLHPTSVTPEWENSLAIIKEQFARNRYIAVGEIGIDLHWDTSLEKEQRLAFEEQLRWSIEYGLPVSIHCRNAVRTVIECIVHVGAEALKGVFHSFSGDAEELSEVLALENFYVGVNGTVTYKNSALPAILPQAGLSRLIIETDAPYLPPVPYRGKRNEPSYTTYVAHKLSEIYGVSYDEVCALTTANARRLYAI